MFNTNWELYDEIIHVVDKDIAVVSDIHFGASKDLEHTKSRLLNIIKYIDPKTLVLNGDLYYLNFSRYHNADNYYKFINQTISDTKDMVDELIFVKGNHEIHLNSRGKKTIENLCEQTYDLYYKIDNIVISHGHADINESSDEYIIGHIHPRKDGDDVYHYKYNGLCQGNLTIMPAFSNSVNGVDIDNYSGRCPPLDENTEEYEHLKVRNI